MPRIRLPYLLPEVGVDTTAGRDLRLPSRSISKFVIDTASLSPTAVGSDRVFIPPGQGPIPTGCALVAISHHISGARIVILGYVSISGVFSCSDRVAKRSAN